MNSTSRPRTGLLRSILATSIGIIAIGSISARAETGMTRAQRARELAISVCSACHGVDGNSVDPIFPRLAGQKAWYLRQQLKEFRANTRGDPYAVAYMWGMASRLSNATIGALAAYFSHQKPGSGTPEPAATVARGRDIYQHGIPAQGIPACAACHGPQALGSAQFPRLAGQHAEYIMNQLQAFQDNMRKVAIMHGVAKTLRRSEMRAVADYLESLP